MDAFSLDMRTLNFVMVLFSCVYCVGLLLYQRTQQRIHGLRMFAFALLAMGVGPLLISFRGVAPDWMSIVAANMLIAFAFHMILHSLCTFRGFHYRYSYFTLALTPLLFGGFVYFTYFQPSVVSRVIMSATFLAIISLFSVLAVIKGKKPDLKLAINMMRVTFILYGGFMVYRLFYTLAGEEITQFMSAGVVHQLTFLFSIFLMVSISFSMLWLINARQLQSINALSYNDSLTQLKNRRALERFVESTISDIPRSQAKLSVIMLDIDRFKFINDEYGHVIGDRVIQAVASTVGETVHVPESTFRFGGDEIMVVLKNTDLDKARQVAEKLRTNVEQRIRVQGLDIKPTCSFGVAEIRENDTWDSLVARADKALYQAKKDGRNLVRTFHDALESRYLA
ncbi:GGDEF domain-containing protein [Vibrio hangzhouensis]|uniref:diguanylate cyclase n=1 Tax=Vibrio hangzhouensis TaxID=462991 RepID=A0A1H5V396_9VIBR|nr:GGDEF domain-containing protein [Vibrio hangzhouensis]SEF81779.1 diguanylate cyclase (GGDEF) domain-containing protein [Vibrio hangzhouensis]